MVTNNATNNMQANQTITTTTVLDETYFGNIVICTGATSYNVTLPSATGNFGKTIKFIFNTTSFALVRLIPAAGTISGQPSIVWGSNESCEVFCDGTNWIVSDQVLAPVTFSVFLSVDQTIPTSVNTIINFDTVLFDFNSFFNLTNGQYFPKYPGKYQFSYTQVWVPTSHAINTLLGANIVLNNVIQICGTQQFTPLDLFQYVSTSGITDMDGFSSFVVAKAFQNTGVDQQLAGNILGTLFCGYRINNI